MSDVMYCYDYLHLHWYSIGMILIPGSNTGEAKGALSPNCILANARSMPVEFVSVRAHEKCTRVCAYMGRCLSPDAHAITHLF